MKRTRRASVHPLFEECARMCIDTFWRDLLLDCSYNKFPSGFMYKEGYLTYRRGKKISKLYLPTEAKEALTQIIPFFKEKDHIYSDKDREDKEAEEKFIPLVEINNWNSLKKKKKLLEIVINEYIREIIEVYHLGVEEKKQLTTIINIAMIQGYFNNDTIEVKHNRILAIKDLSWNEETKFFSLPTCHKKIKMSKSTSRRVESGSSRGRMSTNFYALWQELLKTCSPH